MIDKIFAYLVVGLFFVTLMALILSGPIVDWLYARQKRKKAAAEAKAAVDAAAEASAKPA